MKPYTATFPRTALAHWVSRLRDHRASLSVSAGNEVLKSVLTGLPLSPKQETRETKPENRNSKPETRNPKPENPNLKPETRNQKPDAREPEPNTRNPKPGQRIKGCPGISHDSVTL